MSSAVSIDGVPIRLTDERWEHIISNKPHMESYDDKVLEAIEKPTLVLRGTKGQWSPFFPSHANRIFTLSTAKSLVATDLFSPR